MRIELKVQSLERARETYETHMCRDFPENERKPWEITVDMFRRGIYDMLEAQVEGKMVGYIWIVRPEGRAALIDYLAVLPEYRSSGVGTQILQALTERYLQLGKDLILESEYPEEAPDPKTAVRRLEFYARAGFRDTGVQVRLFGVRFCILACGIGSSAKTHMQNIYHAMFAEELYQKAVAFLS